MPEGDTIAHAAARLRPLLVGEPLLEVRHRGAVLHDLAGETVRSIETHGKRMWIRLGPLLAIHVHLGMEGSWRLISPAGLAASPRRAAAASLALINRLGGALCLTAPTVQIVRGPDARAPVERAGLGPDILGAPLALDEILARARAADDRPLGEAVMDQRIVAGIGNVWKSELCWLEVLDPRAAVSRFSDASLRALFQRAARMMAVNVGGAPRTTTATPGSAPPELGRYWVYRKARTPCVRCGEKILRVMQGAAVPRSTYLCPGCQRSEVAAP